MVGPKALRHVVRAVATAAVLAAVAATMPGSATPPDPAAGEPRFDRPGLDRPGFDRPRFDAPGSGRPGPGNAGFAAFDRPAGALQRFTAQTAAPERGRAAGRTATGAARTAGTPATRRPRPALPHRTTATSAPRTAVRTPPRTAAAARAVTASDGRVVQQALAHINEARDRHDLPPLTLSDRLSAAARQHTLSMMYGCGLDHRCPGEAALGDRFDAHGVTWSTAGENVGWRTADGGDGAALHAVNRITDDMLAERPPQDAHRRNLLSPRFTRIGLSVSRDGNGRVWVTQDFAG
jgi:uncharacterized protein YkwD